jgi:transcription-repair coupling factor
MITTARSCYHACNETHAIAERNSKTKKTAQKKKSLVTASEEAFQGRTESRKLIRSNAFIGEEREKREENMIRSNSLSREEENMIRSNSLSREEELLRLNECTVIQLKEKLRRRGVESRGRKGELIARLVEHFMSDGFGDDDAAKGDSSVKANALQQRTTATATAAEVPVARVRRRLVRRVSDDGSDEEITRRNSNRAISASSQKGAVARESDTSSTTTTTTSLKTTRANNLLVNEVIHGGGVNTESPSYSSSSSLLSLGIDVVKPQYNENREAREKIFEIDFIQDFEKARKNLIQRSRKERLQESSDPEENLAKIFNDMSNEDEEKQKNQVNGNGKEGEKPSERLRRLFAERRERGIKAVKRAFNNNDDISKVGALATLGSSIIDIEKTALATTTNYTQGFSASDKEDLIEQKLSEIDFTLEQNNRASEGYTLSTGGANNSIDPLKLIPGEYVVHRKYGIGKYIGKRVIFVEDVEGGRANGIQKIFLFIKFADDTARIDPEKAARQLYRYASPGAEIKPPKLSKLFDKGGSWGLKEARMQKQIQALVVHQMCVYLQRLQCVREPYKIVTAEEEAKFAELFAFNLTPDQVTAIEDVNDDMTRDTPMDRIVVGDVGFGKTEVAFRAVARACFSGKNSFILAPTTVLAKQHAANVAARFRHLGVDVHLVSRHVSKKVRTEIFEKFQNSTRPQVIVGTHGLLYCENGVYDKLHLLVIDEEQRFGVRHKDQISALKANVDVLTLSATPIPRTLHMAVSGFRDASLVQTPPPERRPIKTNLLPLDLDKIQEAIEFEIARGGQIYYIVPRISMMAEASKRLSQILPNIRVLEAHGQMGGDALDGVMDEFSNGEADVLLCTTIVESGLDIPNCNTIIIEEVQAFGLASLYQLRGRVGRADRQAHAWMFYPDMVELSDKAKERLLALEESCGLGEGFKLAERDMSIRGVGELFGEKQSGEVDSIGADLYLELLYSQLQRIELMRLKPCLPNDVRIIHKLNAVDEDEKIVEVHESTKDLCISPAFIATRSTRESVEKILFSSEISSREFSIASHCLTKHFGEYSTDEYTRCALLEREIAYVAAELGIKEVIIVSSTVKSKPAYAICIVDLPAEIKDMLIKGVVDQFQMNVFMHEDGLRIIDQNKKSTRTRADILFVVVMTLRRISDGVPAFVKLL